MTEFWVPERIKARAWQGEPFSVAHAKLDGHHVRLCKDKDGRCYAFEREVRADLELTRRYPNLVEQPWWNSFTRYAPNSTCIEGECLADGGRRSDVRTAYLGNAALGFKAFAVAAWNGKDAKLHSVAWAFERCDSLEIDFAVFYSSDDVARWGWSTPKDMLSAASRLGFEGWMLKRANRFGWYKVKYERTLDAIIVGAKEGRGKFAGLIGAVRVALYRDGRLEEIASLSGMDDATRVDLTDMWLDETLNGRVVEVEYQQASGKGRLDHPRVKRMRPDKPAKECLWTQIEE